ncbi:hypothetical protein [Methyloglobulus morosus]|uniref:hypothetical protein n=1 Tax=Methyloglobulus morosus TaxID=1410681 RepID=UPI000402680E|nr:hypothetical protein [Methyloglobulus morosus]
MSSGDLSPVWQTITAAREADGEITHYAGFSVDITVQKQAEKVLLKPHSRLENQMASTLKKFEKSYVALSHG